MFRVFIVLARTDNFSHRHRPVSERTGWHAGSTATRQIVQKSRVPSRTYVFPVYSQYSRLFGCTGRRSYRCICCAAAAKLQRSWSSALSLLTIFISLNGNTQAYQCIYTEHTRASHSSVCRRTDKKVRDHSKTIVNTAQSMTCMYAIAEHIRTGKWANITFRM